MGAQPLLPFIKWPGGKRWAARRIAELVSARLTGSYLEPFLGGGAVFFHLRPPKAVLADVNEDLIATYRMVRRNSGAIIEQLRQFRVTEADYYRIRERDPKDPIARAARFLYLNRTAFGGVYRLNLKGRFNVPYGGGERTPAILWQTEVLDHAASALRKAQLKVSDFEPILSLARAGDVAYCDPTYTVAHDNNGFVRYNERNFSWSDQERLAAAAGAATSRGATVIVSNAHHASIRELYPAAVFTTLTRISRVTPNVSLRRPVDELLITLNPAH
jgi:DNA adenine methylase